MFGSACPHHNRKFEWWDKVRESTLCGEIYPMIKNIFIFTIFTPCRNVNLDVLLPYLKMGEYILWKFEKMSFNYNVCCVSQPLISSLQLWIMSHTSLAWLWSSAWRKRTGSGRLVLRLFLSLPLQSDMVCYHLKSYSTFIFVCVVWACACVCPCYSLELSSAVWEQPWQNEGFLCALLPGKRSY